MERATLADCTNRLRMAIRDSLNPAHSPDWTPILKDALRKAQKKLWLNTEFPGMYGTSVLPMVAGGRYYNIPGDFKFEGITRVDRRYLQDIVPLEYGIGPEQYREVDSPKGDRRDPVRRWGWSYTGAGPTGSQLEVWPLPETTTDHELILTIKPPIGVFTEDGHLSTLDADLIVGFAAVDILAMRNPEQAEIADRAAKEMFGAIMHGYNPKPGRTLVFSDEPMTSAFEPPYNLRVK